MGEFELDIAHRGAITEIVCRGDYDARAAERLKEAIEIGIGRGSSGFWVDVRQLSPRLVPDLVLDLADDEPEVPSREYYLG